MTDNDFMMNKTENKIIFCPNSEKSKCPYEPPISIKKQYVLFILQQIFTPEEY
jgi:hypothetical protein